MTIYHCVHTYLVLMSCNDCSATTHNKDLARQLLAILMGNAIMYTLFYVAMKLVHKERIAVHTWIYFVLTHVAWFYALKLFLDSKTKWSVSNGGSCTLRFSRQKIICLESTMIEPQLDKNLEQGHCAQVFNSLVRPHVCMNLKFYIICMYLKQCHKPLSAAPSTYVLIIVTTSSLFPFSRFTLNSDLYKLV